MNAQPKIQTLNELQYIGGLPLKQKLLHSFAILRSFECFILMLQDASRNFYCVLFITCNKVQTPQAFFKIRRASILTPSFNEFFSVQMLVKFNDQIKIGKSRYALALRFKNALRCFRNVVLLFFCRQNLHVEHMLISDSAHI